MNPNLIYEEVPISSRAAIEQGLKSGDPTQIGQSLLQAALYEADWHWVQDRCLDLLQHPDQQVRSLAITSLGHLARIHGVLDRERVIPTLQALQHDPSLVGRIEDALDDIHLFTRDRINVSSSVHLADHSADNPAERSS